MGNRTHWIKSGLVNQYIPFYAEVAGIESGAVVTRQRGPNSGTTMDTPTIVADGAREGLYRILVDEDTTISTGEETEAMILIIDHANLAIPVEIHIMLYDNISVNTKKTNDTPMLGDGTVGNLWRGNP